MPFCRSFLLRKAFGGHVRAAQYLLRIPRVPQSLHTRAKFSHAFGVQAGVPYSIFRVPFCHPNPLFCYLLFALCALSE